MTPNMIIAGLSIVIAIDHLLQLIPSINANNTFQLISNILTKLFEAMNPPPPAK